MLHLLLVHKLLLLAITLHYRLAIHIDHAGVHRLPFHLLLIHHLLLLLHRGVFVHHLLLLPSAIFLHLLLVFGGWLLGTVGSGGGLWRGGLLDLRGLFGLGRLFGGLFSWLLGWLLLLTLSWLLLFRLVAHILNI